MSNKPKKRAVTRKGSGIEVAMGEIPPTNFEIMNMIAKAHTIYGATVWLNTPLEEHENKTPAELMREGKMDIVANLARALKK